MPQSIPQVKPQNHDKESSLPDGWFYKQATQPILGNKVMLKIALRRVFEYPQHIVWLKSKKNTFHYALLSEML